MNDVDVTGKKLGVNDDSMSFPVPIWEWLDFGDVVVIILEEIGEPHQYRKRNVLGISPDARIEWVVPRAPDPADSGATMNYTSINRKHGDQLWAYNANGFSYRLDSSDGSILDRQFKR